MIRVLTLEGFRGVRGRLSLEFARLTLLAGRNGLGKSTVFDAIDWCLFGATSRLGADPDAAMSLYAPHTSPLVSLEIVVSPEQPIRVQRTKDGATWDGHPVSDRDIALRLANDADIFPPHIREPSERLRRLCYLPQETLRDLLAESEDETRAGLLDALAGVPHAAVVTASLRKVRERLQERNRSAANEIGALVAEQEELAAKRLDLGVRRAEEEGPLLERVAELLNLSDSGRLSPPSLLQVARERLRETLQRQNMLLETVTYLQEMDAEATRLKVSLDALDRRQHHLEPQLDAASAQLSELEHTVVDLQRQHQDLQHRAAQARQRAVAIRRDAETASESSRLRDHLTRARANADEARARLAHSAASIAALSSALQERHAELQASQARHRALLTSRQQIKRTQEIRQALEIARGASVTAGGRLGELRADEKRLALALQNAVAAEATARAALAATARRSAARDELRQNLERVAELARRLDLAWCPLCGVDHGSRDSLVAAVVAAKARLTGEEPPSILAARGAVEQSRRVTEEIGSLHRRSQSEIAKYEREMAQGHSEVEDLARQLRQLSPPASGATDAAALDAAILSAERELTQVRDGISTLEADYGRGQAELSEETARQRLASQEVARLATLLAEREGAHASELPKDGADPDSLEADAARAERSVEGLGGQLGLLGGKKVDIHSSLASLQGTAADLRSQRASTLRRLDLARNDMVARLRVALAPSRAEDVAGGTAQLSAEIERVGELRRRLEREIPGIETLVLLREQAQRTQRLETLAQAITELGERKAELQRAAARFTQLAAAIEARRDAEGRDVVRQVQETIQECVRAMSSPHHLDQVQVDSSGTLRLSDRLLQPRSVSPRLYTSVGQQNVIALALFLALAVRQSVSRLPLVLLDEPVQNLDDLNFLAFVALLKRIVEHRQVVVATADGNVEAIIARQLRNWNEGRFAHYVWESFTPERGPSVRRVERLAARVV
jgi:DNA repair exonuclease SbcCD ATPase subunit